MNNAKIVPHAWDKQANPVQSGVLTRQGRVYYFTYTKVEVLLLLINVIIISFEQLVLLAPPYP